MIFTLLSGCTDLTKRLFQVNQVNRINQVQTRWIKFWTYKWVTQQTMN